MNLITVELLDPKVEALLHELAALNLIKIRETKSTSARLEGLLMKLRSNEAELPSAAEITEAVEAVRTERHREPR